MSRSHGSSGGVPASTPAAEAATGSGEQHDVGWAPPAVVLVVEVEAPGPQQGAPLLAVPLG
jgi:hypothetical protein